MMELNPKSWWALLSLALVGCGSAAEPSRDEAGEASSNLQASGGLEISALAVEAATAAAADAPCPSCGISVTPNTGLRRILLLSVDGLHAADYYKYVALYPRSNIGKLYLHGVDYPNATTTTPSGGFSGILALATGGSPKTTGVYDQDSYDRTLYPPGSNCVGTPGTEVIYDGSVAHDWSQLFSPINKTNLPLTKDTQGRCVEVYPHNFLKTSTIFEVIQGTGRRTAWNDNHASYEILAGPSGKGLSEFYSPDVTSFVANGGTVNGVNLTGSLALCDSTNSVGSAPLKYTMCVPAAQAYDDVKVQAVINKIDGFSADGSRQSAVPTILGLNFAAVDVAQRLRVGGYINNVADPTELLKAALDHVDFSIGRILTELDTRHFIEKTLIVLTAKHGQSPIDPTKWRTEVSSASGVGPVQNPLITVNSADNTVDGVWASFVNPNSGRRPATSGHVQTADSAIVWLQNQNNVNVTNVNAALNNSSNGLLMGATVRPQGSIFSTNIAPAAELIQAFGDARSSSDLLAAARAPNAFVQPDLGVIYTQSSDHVAEHGGGTQDDINVPLLIANPGIVNHVSISEPVSTKQVATTILRALTMDGTKLTAASAEGTSTLPGIVWGPGTYQGGSTIKAVDYSSQTGTQVSGPPPYVGNFNAGSSVCFNDVYLTDVVSITATVASANTSNNSAFSVRIDGPNGTKVGQVTVLATGGWTTWKTVSIPIAPAQTGLHTVCFRGETGTGIANLLNFYLVPVCVPECTNATCGSDGCGGTCGTCGFNFLCDDPFAQCIVPPKKYSVVETALPSLIPAPAHDVQSGTQLGTGSTTVLSFDANDYVCYYGVELDNVQKIVTTLASATGGGTLSFRIDSPTGEQIGSYTVPSTGGATTFKSKQIPLTATYSGTRALCVRGETGTGIATLQSFQLSDQPVLPKYIVGSTILASPPDAQQGTTNDPTGNVANFDATDFVCYEEVDLGGVNSIVANVSSANGGGSFSARVGSQSGARIATFRVPNTGGWTTFINVASNITTSGPGMTTLCFVGESGSGIANLKSFTLSSTVIPSKYALGSIILTTPPDTQQGTTNDAGGWISNFDANDYYCYDSVDLTGVNSIVASIASANSGGVLSVRVGSQTGTRIGQSIVLNTGGWTTFANLNIAVAPPVPPGVTTLCITGDTGSGIGNIRSLTLSGATVAKNFSLGGVIPGGPTSSQQGITINGTSVTYFDANDWFCYDGVDLTGVRTITARAASGSAGNRFSVRIGSQTGFQVGSFTTTNTGGYNSYANWNVGITNSPGVHMLCFFGLSGTGIANFQNFTLSP